MSFLSSFPPVVIAFFSVITGLLFLVGGGEFLVKGATRLAKRLGVPSYIVGLTVVAFGTSVPELFISLMASLQGHPDLMVGNIVGSNIANVGLILGCCALLAQLELRLDNVKTELIIVLTASVLLMLCSGYQIFPRSVGALFLGTLICYTVFLCIDNNKKRSPTNGSELPTESSGLLIAIGKVFVGLVLLAFGSDIFIDGAVIMAKFFGVSDLVIGLTLAAVGTSLPELASSIVALRHKETGLIIGNIIGSNMFNLLMVLGITGLIKPFALEQNLLQRDLPVMLLFTIILIPMLIKDGKTRRWQGAILLAGYTGYCISLL